MSDVWILLFLLPLGAKAFMIHNAQFSLCLEDSAATGEVLLRKCNLNSESQQWIWTNQAMLMSVESTRCLSALDREPVRTQTCWGSEVDATGLMWDCDRGRLINKNTSMLLSVDGWRLILTHGSKHTKWRSLDQGDICQEKLRSRRASDEFEAEEEEKNELTEEQREYLRWFYRTEDPTMWTFVLLGLAFVCLLVGFLLLGMGAMANKNRKKIAKYKAAAAVARKNEDLLICSTLREDSQPSLPLDRLMQGNKPSPPNGEVSELTAGSIVVTWKDGNTSCLYPDPVVEEEKQEDNQEEKQEDNQEEKQEDDQEEKQEVALTAEPEADEAVKTLE